MFFLAAAACACEIPFSIDDISEPRYMIEYVPTAGDTGSDLRISYAEPAYGKRMVGAYDFKNCTVGVKINGKDFAVGALEWLESGNTIRTTIGGSLKAGDKLEVSVSGGSAPKAGGSTIIPELPAVSSIDIVKSDDKEESSGRRFTVNMARDVESGEYYGIKITVHEDMYFAEMLPAPPFVKLDTTYYHYNVTPGQVASMSDINNMDLDAFAQVNYNYGHLIGEVGQDYSFSAMSLLSDRQFSGKSYSFYVNSSFSFDDIFDGMPDIDSPDVPEEPYSPEEPEEPEESEEPVNRILFGVKTWYEVEIYALSEELYNYCKAQYLENFNILANFGVTPPNFTYSNVSGGIGIVGGVSRCVFKIDDPENKKPEIPDFSDYFPFAR